MAERFSSAVRVADLNDFIAPSQACVVSLGGNKKAKLQSEDDLGFDDRASQRQQGLVHIHAKTFSQTKAAPPDQPVKVSLHDCLACSGCITSAETVMLEQQSTGEFLEQLAKGDRQVVVSLSPQSRASLATYFSITPLQAFKRLTEFLKSLGVRAVYDTSCSRDVSLLESCAEFVERYKQSQEASTSGRLPMLTSACPGWICYAEKTHGQYILPYISTTKSPQQVMGTVIKGYASQQLGLRPGNVYHVAVMPCYDKKLEASRDDFLLPGSDDAHEVPEVDCVLTSGEILELLESRGVDLAEYEESPLDTMQLGAQALSPLNNLPVYMSVLFSNVDESGQLFGVPGGSGGYLEVVFRYAAQHLFGKQIAGPLPMRVIRNVDFQEVENGQVLLRFALAYGFRNIQNLVRKLKTSRSDYHFVEIMACPSGCLNGGGQIKPRKGETGRQLIDRLEKTYLDQVAIRAPETNPMVQKLYADWLGGVGSEQAKLLLHTGYHQREKTVTMQISNW
eukprot:jgi/Chlat1/4115/Chrsp26S04125